MLERLDVNTGIEQVTSEFEVVHEAGIMLKFSTRNELLHWLSLTQCNCL